MAKYIRKKQRKQKKAVWLWVLLVVLTLLLAAMIWLAKILEERQIPTLDQIGVPMQTQVPGSAQESAPEQNDQESTQPQSINLSDGLVMEYISGYAGMYMEDGTNEPVADVMMILLENTSEQDLQLARISIEYADFTAEFEVTNLPAGEKVVALEKNRHPEAAGEYLSIQTKNVVFFQKPMSLQEDRIKIEGADGSLKVTNISGEDIAGDIYIYYKNSASDLLYGGITYRVAVKGGLKAGESARIIAGHYTPDNCRLLLVDCVE